MKILFVFEQIDLHEVHLVRGLSQGLDVEVDVLCSMQGHNHRLLSDLGIPVERSQYRSKVDFAAINRIREKLEEGAYDIVHAFTSRALANVLWAVRRLVTRPQVVMFRGIMDRVKRFDPATWMTYYHPNLTAVSCISDSARRGLEASRVQAELRTIHLGIDRSWFERPQHHTSAKLPIPEGAFAVGCVANIRPVKGIDLLLQAATRLTKYTDIHWLLIGSLDDQRVAELANDPRIVDRVHLLGFRSDVEQLVRQLDLFVMPSRKEGLSKSLMEAMGQRVCPIISDVGGMPELVRHQQDGLVFAKEDVAGLTEAIETLYTNHALRDRYAQSAQQRIFHDFSTQQMIDKTHHLYQDILSRPIRQAA